MGTDKKIIAAGSAKKGPRVGTVRNSRGPRGRGEPLTPSAVPVVTGVSGWTAGVRWRGVLEHWTAASASGHFLCISRTLFFSQTGHGLGFIQRKYHHSNRNFTLNSKMMVPGPGSLVLRSFLMIFIRQLY